MSQTRELTLGPRSFCGPTSLQVESWKYALFDAPDITFLFWYDLTRISGHYPAIPGVAPGHDIRVEVPGDSTPHALAVGRCIAMSQKTAYFVAFHYPYGQDTLDLNEVHGLISVPYKLLEFTAFDFDSDAYPFILTNDQMTATQAWLKNEYGCYRTEATLTHPYGRCINMRRRAIVHRMPVADGRGIWVDRRLASGETVRVRGGR